MWGVFSSSTHRNQHPLPVLPGQPFPMTMLRGSPMRGTGGHVGVPLIEEALNPEVGLG